MTLPKRTASTVPIVNDLSSPSGRMSKRARTAAEKRIESELFGPGGIDAAVAPRVRQPTKAAYLLGRAASLRDWATRQSTERRACKYYEEAERCEAEAAALDN